ncbi:MAG TPA: hypothetical protein ENJ76_02980 [Oceanithermus sp.]|nr:hypothetical protein [Oceanithermus sp.]
MKIAVIEGEREVLRRLAEGQPHPYRLLAGSEGHLLLVEGVEEATLRSLAGHAPRVFVLEEEGCGKRSSSSP